MPRPRPFWTLDCETDPFESSVQAVARRHCPECGANIGAVCKTKKGENNEVHEKRRRIPRPFIWGAFNGDTYETFADVQNVVEFFESNKTVVYAHNGGKFDYHYMREHVNTDEPISIIGGRLAKFRIGVCEFRDSMNILPVPLGAFKKDEIDYAIMEPDMRDDPNHRATILRYLRSDCVYLHELISAHRAENGVVLTQAGASMRAWLKQSKRSRPRQSALYFERYKPYYYGGRVQCFEQGAQRRPFKVIDINSAYPYAMLSRHPISSVGSQMSHLPPEGHIHECMITLRATARGCFPFRDEKDGSLYFPHDEHEIREYHVTGYELIAALEYDAITNINIERVHRFTEMVDFADFIQDNWKRRAQAKENKDEALSLIVKLLMNSLYGKFSSDYAKYFDYVLASPDSMNEWLEKAYQKDKVFAKDKYLMQRSIEYKLTQEEESGKSRYYNIVTAASITGYVRAMLFSAMQKCSGLIYCDTDSIAAQDVSGCNIGNELGQWKVEDAFDYFAIAGKKTYAFHKDGEPFDDTLTEKNEYAYWKLASKGVDLSPSELIQVATGTTVKYSPLVPTYSIKRETPVYVSRDVRRTAKDIRYVK
jgi:hypothetical protein